MAVIPLAVHFSSHLCMCIPDTASKLILWILVVMCHQITASFHTESVIGSSDFQILNTPPSCPRAPKTFPRLKGINSEPWNLGGEEDRQETLN